MKQVSTPREGGTNKHTLDHQVAVLGDSTVDNKVYLDDGVRSTDEWLTELLAGRCGGLYVTANDGDVCADIPGQRARLPEGPYDHVVLSVGGNDALRSLELLDGPVGGLDRAIHAFRKVYTRALEACLDLRPGKLTVCTVYAGDFSDLGLEIVCATRTGVGLFNDVIYREAARVGASVVELRDVCSTPQHFTQHIEPSGRGGEAIARRIAKEVLSDGGRREKDAGVLGERTRSECTA